MNFLCQESPSSLLYRGCDGRLRLYALGVGYRGPGGTVTPGCVPADSDCDGDVDNVDLGNLLSNLNL